MSEAIQEAVKMIQEQIVSNENVDENNKEITEEIQEEKTTEDKTQEKIQEKEDTKKDDEKNNINENQEAINVPEWATDIKNQEEYDVANMLNGGQKAEWLTKGYDKFTDEQKQAFSKIHSKWDKWKNEQNKKKKEVETLTTKQETSKEISNDELIEKLLEVINKEHDKKNISAEQKEKNITEKLKDIKKQFVEASQDLDEEKIGNVFDELVNSITKVTQEKTLKIIEEREKERFEKQKEENFIKQIQSYEEEIEGIIASGDRRIERYLQIDHDGTNPIGRLLAFGDVRTGRTFSSVREVYNFLLKEDRNGSGNNLPKPNFSDIPQNKSNFSENDFDVSTQRMKELTVKEWMNEYPGFK